MRTLRQDIDRRFRGQWLAIAVVALFPRIARRKPGYDSPMRVLRRVALGTLLQFALRHWVRPRLREATELHRRGTAELTERLGREPTAEELREHLLG